jgi:hypothetical protein
MKKIIIFGSNHINTSLFYEKLNVDKSVLVNSVDQSYTIGHTSKQDFDSDSDLEECLSNADEVYWASSKPAEFLNLNVFYETVEWLKKYHSEYKNVKNISQIKFDPYNWNHNLPKLTVDDAVFLGCSFTRGTALSDSNTHYASLVSKYFNKNCVNLAQRGLNNQTSFELLTQLDFCPGQIVVWQITYLERMRYIDSHKQIKDILFSCIPKDLLLKLTDIYNKDFLFYELVGKIRAVINLARMKKISLVFWLVDYKNETLYSYEDQKYFYEFPEFVPAYKLQNYIIDCAEDELHPGIESNKIIASVLTEHLKNLYEI